MAITRSVLYVRDLATIQFHYGKKSPSTGVYYDSTEITAANLTIYDSAGTALVGPVAMSYVAALRGRVYDWTYGAALTGLGVVYAYVTPTRAGSVAAALAPDEIVPIDLSDIQQRLDETAAADIAEHDATQASVAANEANAVSRQATNIAEHDATQVSILTRESEADAATRATTDQTEHDATQVAIAAIPATDLSPVLTRLDNAAYGLAALNTDLDALIARLGLTADTGGSSIAGTAQAKLNAIQLAIIELGNTIEGGDRLTIELQP